MKLKLDEATQYEVRVAAKSAGVDEMGSRYVQAIETGINTRILVPALRKLGYKYIKNDNGWIEPLR